MALAVAATSVVQGVAGAPPANATNGCPPPIRAVLDGTPPTHARNVALTFDDGPSPRWTPQVLDVLRARGVRATFFVIGSNVDAHPWIVRRIIAEGHAIGNHTYSHANLDRLSRAGQAAEMDRGAQAIHAATRVRPCLFRGPYGAHHSASVKELAWQRGMNIAGWSHDTRDYQSPPGYSPLFQGSIVYRATNPLVAHPTVLLHDGSPGNYRQNTVDAVDRIISFYASRGYAFTDPAGRPFPSSAIQMRYNGLGGPVGFLGVPVSAEHRTPGGTGAFTHYRGGSIYWSPATGARFVRGAIRNTWSSLGWELSVLRYPTTDELRTPRKLGAFNHFQNGSIYWSPATGAHVVRGAIRNKWSRLGWENSSLGFPATNELPTPTKPGAFNRFENGSIYWSPATGAHVVRGAIRNKWSRLGWENSSLGFPATDELPTPTKPGAFNRFENGSIYWSATTGANFVRGPIRTKWAELGWENSFLGFPTTDELPTATKPGAFNRFQNGSIYWSETTGAHVVGGAIRAKWAELGSENSSLGFPTSDESPTPAKPGAFNHFENDSSIYWSPTTGAHAVQGAIRAKWAELGSENSSLGFPVSDGYVFEDGLRSDFENGYIVWTPSTGAVVHDG